MASNTVDVSLCTQSKVIPSSPSKAMEHQSPRGASSLQKLSSIIPLSDLKATLGGGDRGERGASGVEKVSQGVVV